MEFNIKIFEESQLVGKKVNMSFVHNKTKELWMSFSPQKEKIKNRVGIELFSVEIYKQSDFFENFNPNKEFEKWAAVKVSNGERIPEDMLCLNIPAGLYAVFSYKGKADEAKDFYQSIFGTCLPASDYELDNRPHLAIMGSKYIYDHPESEEEIWIPVRRKSK